MFGWGVESSVISQGNTNTTTGGMELDTGELLWGQAGPENSHGHNRTARLLGRQLQHPSV